MCRGACNRMRLLCDLRFDSKEDERSYVEHFAGERSWVSSLSCVTFFVPFATFQALALQEASDEERLKFGSSLGIHFIAVFLVCFLASACAMLACCARRNPAVCRFLEPFWTSLAVSSLGLLLSIFAHGEQAQPSAWQRQASPNIFVVSLIVSIFSWLPVRSVVSSFLVLLALLLSVVAAFFENGPAAMEVCMLALVLGSSYRLAYMCERTQRNSWFSERNSWSDIIPAPDESTSCSKKSWERSPRATPIGASSTRSRRSSPSSPAASDAQPSRAISQSSHEGVSSKSPVSHNDRKDPADASDGENSDKASVVQCLSPVSVRDLNEGNSAEVSGKDVNLTEAACDQAGPKPSRECVLCALRLDISLTIQEVSQYEIKLLGFDPAGRQFLSLFDDEYVSQVKQLLDSKSAMTELLHVYVRTSSGSVFFELRLMPTGIGDPAFLALLHAKPRGAGSRSATSSRTLPSLPAVPEHDHSKDGRKDADASLDSEHKTTGLSREGSRSLFGGGSESGGSSISSVEDEAAERNEFPEFIQVKDEAAEISLPSPSVSSQERQERALMESSSSSSSEGSKLRKASERNRGTSTLNRDGLLFSPVMSGSASSLYALSSDSLASWDIGSSPGATPIATPVATPAAPSAPVPVITTSEAHCQTSLHWDDLGWKCKLCEKPPLPASSLPSREVQWQMHRQARRRQKRRRSRTSMPNSVLDGMWVMVQGPTDTSNWLKKFFVRGDLVQSCDGRMLELKLSDSSVYLAGGELLMDDEGRLHRRGRSGHHFIYERAGPKAGSAGSSSSSGSEQARPSENDPEDGEPSIAEGFDPDEVDCDTDEESVTVFESKGE
eukprot:TRINITY_DN3511_c0_g1_i1.p1 TRINITY_DN3511_c0_g1~~TRINITY_DN3511_c0_g1_i1.p1  ORF type:complete len:852 (-),score=117.93 TRINITY_DN3511_c0_g1_i1:115-2628(-)